MLEESIIKRVEKTIELPQKGQLCEKMATSKTMGLFFSRRKQHICIRHLRTSFPKKILFIKKYSPLENRLFPLCIFAPFYSTFAPNDPEAILNIPLNCYFPLLHPSSYAIRPHSLSKRKFRFFPPYSWIWWKTKIYRRVRGVGLLDRSLHALGKAHKRTIMPKKEKIEHESHRGNHVKNTWQ